MSDFLQPHLLSNLFYCSKSKSKSHLQAVALLPYSKWITWLSCVCVCVCARKCSHRLLDVASHDESKLGFGTWSVDGTLTACLQVSAVVAKYLLYWSNSNVGTHFFTLGWPANKGRLCCCQISSFQCANKRGQAAQHGSTLLLWWDRQTGRHGRQAGTDSNGPTRWLTEWPSNQPTDCCQTDWQQSANSVIDTLTD